METKVFEIRDRATFMPVLAIRLQINPGSSNEEWLLWRAGYSHEDIETGCFVLLTTLNGGKGRSTCDPYYWSSSTLTPAHAYIAKHWDQLEPGQVIDAEFIRGESATPRTSERLLSVFGE